MKRFYGLFLSFLILSTSFSSCNKSNNFGELLIELESNMGWNSVNEVWRSRRDGWLSETRNANSTAKQAQLLMEFESIVLWTAVNPKWTDIRNQWIMDCENTQNT